MQTMHAKRLGAIKTAETAIGRWQRSTSEVAAEKIAKLETAITNTKAKLGFVGRNK